MRIADWPRYHYRAEVLSVTDGDTFRARLGGMFGAVAGIAKGLAIVHSRHGRVRREAGYESQSPLWRTEVGVPFALPPANQWGKRNRVVGVQIPAAGIAAPPTCVVVSGENEGSPFVPGPLANQHHHLCPTAPVRVARTAHAGGVATATKPTRATADRLVAPFAWLWPTPPKVAVCPALFAKPERGELFARRNLVYLHPPRDGSQRTPRLFGDLSQRQPLAFIPRAQPLAVFVGILSAARSAVAFNQLGAARGVSALPAHRLGTRHADGAFRPYNRATPGARLHAALDWGGRILGHFLDLHNRSGGATAGGSISYRPALSVPRSIPDLGVRGGV